MILLFAFAFLWATLADAMPEPVWYAGTLLLASLVAFVVGRDTERREQEKSRRNE